MLIADRILASHDPARESIPEVPETPDFHKANHGTALGFQ